MSIANEPAFRDAEGCDFGLTKREYFAAMALQGLLASPSSLCECAWRAERQAVVRADALIEELEKGAE